MKEFIQEVEDLLLANPYFRVDLLPLVLKYTENKSDSEIDGIRMKILRYLSSYKESGFIMFDNEFAFTLSVKIYNQYPDSPLYISSTHKFETEYNKKHTPAPTPIHHIQNIETNYGIAAQGSDLRDIDFRPAKNPQTQPKIVEKKRVVATPIISLLKFISTNPLISGILALIVGTLILVYFKFIK